MPKKLVAAVCLFISSQAGADTRLNQPLDTARIIDVDEIVVVASPKENTRLRSQALSLSMLDKKEMEKRDIHALKNLTGNVPNFFIPDYGSRITSAVYIRGIGSRINTPAVGLYVDNVPYADKSAYDFNFTDVERIDVLRGPQATLYGRNAMGGLLHVHTANPLNHHGTDIQLGTSLRNGGRKASFTTYLHPAYGTGLSISGFYNGQDGFFRNAANEKKADASDAGGGRIKLAYRPTESFKIDWTASYEYSDEGACPYYYEGTRGEDKQPEPYPESLGLITSNRPSNYRRSMFNTGIHTEWNADNGLALSSITAFQHLNDRLFMDQDFIRNDIFGLEQKQYMQTVSEEVVLRNRPDRRWARTTGLFFMYQYMRTNCPVTFYEEGMDYLNTQLEQLSGGIPGMPPMSLAFNDKELLFQSSMQTPSTNVALFHQSTLHDVFIPNLSFTVGLRLDYDYHRLRLGADTRNPVSYGFAMPSFGIGTTLQDTPVMNGARANDTWQILPKFALTYNLSDNLGNVYATVSKGYRSGGYNIQQYSDLAEKLLRRQMMTSVQDYSAATIRELPFLPDAAKENAIKGMTAAISRVMPEYPDIRTLYYKPEQTWNYEVGTHLNLLQKSLSLDAAFFLMNTRDQQLAVFAESNFGRRTINAGKSRSCGMELSLKSASFDNRLNIAVNYGYTHAVFTDFKITDGENLINYEENRVPFVPEHTIGLSADFRQPLRNRLVRAVGAGLGMTGAGRIYWNEQNSRFQNFYATLNMHLTAEMKNISIDVWGKNLTDTGYDTFYFESMGRGYTQRGIPCHAGIDLRFHF